MVGRSNGSESLDTSRQTGHRLGQGTSRFASGFGMIWSLLFPQRIIEINVSVTGMLVQLWSLGHVASRRCYRCVAESAARLFGPQLN